jgi:tRNA-specific 2-thiouridylase
MGAMAPIPQPGTVIAAMSGGVDSAVAALLLLRAGHRVQGLYMSNWDEEDAYCTSAEDFQDARRVCDTLDIPLHTVSFAAQYRERVFTHFLAEYAAGRTPNPDVLCNREIKFGVCLEYMRRLGAERIATGHYARVEHGAHGADQMPAWLLKARDTDKDQSYFLHAVAPAALAMTIFPLGELRKAEVRRLARTAGLGVHDKRDSTGICFIGERPFADFLARYVARTPGPIETAEGRVVGEHAGLAFHTLGQRSGLGLGGRRGAADAPWYVAAKDVARNALIVVQSENHPLLMAASFDVEAVHWLAEALPHRECGVKTRYRQRDLPCRLDASPDGRWRVTLGEPARAVTPGQYAVFYDGDRCLGGGVIARTFAGTEPAVRGIAYNDAISAEGS